MSYEQNKERLSSPSRRDGYISYVSTRDNEVQKRPYCRSIAKEHDLAHHAYLRLPPLRRRGVKKCKTPPPSVSTPGAPTTSNGKTSASAQNLSATTTATAKKTTTTTATAIRNRLQPQL